MTNDSKENLLRILLNETPESPGTPGGKFINTGYKSTTYLGQEIQQISYNNFTVSILNTGEVLLFDENNTLLMRDYLVVNNQNWLIDTLDIDNEGMAYAIAHYIDSEQFAHYYLCYLNNLTVPSENTYSISLRKSYDITSNLSNIKASSGSAYCLKKSPIDSRFFIGVSSIKVTGNTDYKNVYGILYKVNFEGSNDFEYRSAIIGTEKLNRLKGFYVSWTQDNLSVSLIMLNSAENAYTAIDPGNVEFYECRFDFSENSQITSTQILSLSDYVAAANIFEITSVAYKDINTFYFPANSKSGDLITGKIYRYNGTLTNIYTKQNTYDNGRVTILLKSVNNQIFAGLAFNVGEYQYTSYFAHIINATVNSYEMGTQTGIYGGILIQNTFNVYNICVNSLYGIYIYKNSGYNGTPYFSDTSVTSETLTLYKSNSSGEEVPMFNRDLYNKFVIDNTITSVTQIPYNYLNDVPIVAEELISKNENTIDKDNQSIEKNSYEELYINNIDTLKVYDNNNNGSTYNQESSLEVAENIFNGFEGNYKITNYRINYKDGTHEDNAIQNVSRTDNIGTIKIFIYNNGIKNIELYDTNYTTPFVTIDLSNYSENKIYQILQKVKVE